MYNNATRAPLIWSRMPGKLVFFIPEKNTKYNAIVDELIHRNDGRYNIETIKMWASRSHDGPQSWSFFSPCTEADGSFTTSLIGTERACNQTAATSPADEISASGGFHISQSALPFGATGHMRGLTLQRTFDEVLRAKKPNLFVSSFNEHIGGRLKPPYRSELAFNMGLPDDSQRFHVWVDTYGVEFSRDIEPTVEGGNRVWEVAASCVRMYKAHQTCEDDSNRASANEPCCTTSDKLVYANAWSLRHETDGHGLVTSSKVERDELVAGGGWKEVCNPIVGPSIFCVDRTMNDGRDGPFMLYSTRGASMAPLEGARLIALRRCVATNSAEKKHFLSIDSSCEGMGTPETVIGYLSSMRGWETLRALRRCENDSGGFTHALDLGCKYGGMSTLLGYVR